MYLICCYTLQISHGDTALQYVSACINGHFSEVYIYIYIGDRL